MKRESPFKAHTPTSHFFPPTRQATQLLVIALLVLCAGVSGQAQLGGNVSQITLKSAVLGEDRVVLVRTPAGYDANKQSYPVLYITDGDAHIGHTASTIEFLARNGRMSELIVVGIPNTDRTRDLSPVQSSAKATDGKLQFPTSGGADNFLKFIETELIPNIEKNYRVRPYRILAGHSLGGLFAIHAMIARPGAFHSYVAVSPALQWEDEEIIRRAEEFFKSRKDLNATLYVTLGNEPGPIGQSFNAFKRLLATTQIKDFVWEARQMDDEDHGSVVMPSHYAGLRKIYDGWQMPRDHTGAISGGLKGVDEHYQKLSWRFGYQIPAPELLINQLGYQALFAGKTEEAIAIFKANVERYPGSANVYDSLAEAYEKSNRIELAQPLYEKAQWLGQQNNDPNLVIYKANFERASEKMKQTQAKKANEDR
jgi:predicted alpha/beta superfamily hydrolase